MGPCAIGSIEKQVHFVHGLDVHFFDCGKRNEEDERSLPIEGESFFGDDKRHGGVREGQRGGPDAHRDSVVAEGVDERRELGRRNDFDSNGSFWC